MTAATELCAYCGHELSQNASDNWDSHPIPALDDQAGWEQLRAEHAPDCEWYLTRAHRIARLDLDAITLEAGSHAPGAGYCIEELVAALAGEDWTDSPACVSPVIASYCRVLNDRWPDEQRQRLKAYAARQIGTRDGRDLERAYLCADAAVRVFAPIALDAAGLPDRAATLRALAPVADRVTADAADAAYPAYAVYADLAADPAYAVAAYAVAYAVPAYAVAAYAAYAVPAYAVAADAAALELLDRLCAVGRDEVSA